MTLEQVLELLDHARATENEQLIKLCNEYIDNPLYSFVPRPDQAGDQQTSFIEDEFPGLAVVLGGNASGKTQAGAVKFARFILNTPPPRANTPAWVVGQSFAQACGVCWDEKLCQLISPCYIQSVDWFNKNKNWPRAVVLKKHKNGHNWIIHFQSSDQERKRLQGASVALCWLDEQVKHSIIMECWARLRDYAYPGSFFYTLTPLEPDAELEAIYNEREKHPDWKFYRLDSRLNTAIPAGFMERLVESEIDQRKETRLTGAFASFQGQVYPTFSDMHLVDPFEPPHDWFKIRGIDFGYSDATVCLWIAKDHQGRYYVYREYYASQRYLHEHAESILQVPWPNDGYHGPTYMDYGAAQERAEFIRMGIPNLPAKKHINPGIACVQKLLSPERDGRPRLFIAKDCEHLIREMRSYRWHPVVDKPMDTDSHAPDALRYGIYSDFTEAQPDWGIVRMPERRRKAI